LGYDVERITRYCGKLKPCQLTGLGHAQEKWLCGDCNLLKREDFKIGVKEASGWLAEVDLITREQITRSDSSAMTITNRFSATSTPSI